jgi:hypothetical protein
MDSNDKSFRQNFEILLALFKKLADKMAEGEIQGMNPEFSLQFKMMLGQYEMMKHMMPHNIPEQFREPFRQMMENMIHQLKEEVGEDFMLTPEKKEIKLEEEQTIGELEELLRQPGLDQVEMDRLLDKLVEIKSKKG